MNETCEKAEKFLGELTEQLGLDLKVSASMTDEGCLLDLNGDDVGLAHAENGELLDAFETLLFQVMGRELDREHRIVFDRRVSQNFTPWRVSRRTKFERAEDPSRLAYSIRPSGASSTLHFRRKRI